MANTKNDTGKSGADKQSGTEASTAGKVSAGTSVGNIGEAPMPHAHDTKSAQGTSTAAGGGQSGGQSKSSQSGQSSGQSSQQNAQDQGGMTGKAQQAADQVRQKAGDAYEGASEWARDTYERASGTYSQQRRRMNQMGGRSARAFGNAHGGVQSYVSENPMVVGLVGLATGLLIGALLPRTRRENEMFGEWADEVRNQGLRYAREAADRGREYVEETLGGGDDDAQFSRHESEFGGQRDANRH